MKPHYDGVVCRNLRQDERRITSFEAETPFVIEPEKSAELSFLQSFLAQHGNGIREKIAAHGAVLLRGFKTNSPKSFELALSSLKGFVPFEKVFMCLPTFGREISRGTQFVFHTNSKYKTGGTLRLGTFHTENFYLPDIPRYICFASFTTSWLGGETGLVNMTKVYEDLPSDLQGKLCRKTFFAAAWPLQAIADFYNKPVDEVEEFCRRQGWTLKVNNGVPTAALFKPVVLVHPTDNSRSLQFHLVNELPQLGAILRRKFAPDYSGLKWSIHRASWRYPMLMNLGQIGSLMHIGTVFEFLRRGVKHPARDEGTREMGDRVVTAFNREELEVLAESIRRHFSVFTWKSGDVLLVDNIKMAHAGMPGFGPRNIRVMFGNPVVLNYEESAPGCQQVADESCESLGSLMSSNPAASAETARSA